MLNFDRIRESIVNALDQNKPAAPKTLFHYTSASAVEGILESGIFWATHIEFLNDPAERSYVDDLFRKSIVEFSAHESSDVGREFLAYLSRNINRPSGGPHYVVCFCEEWDLLSQWRAYASDSGYALGLVGSEVRSGRAQVAVQTPHYDRKTREEPVEFTLRKIDYDGDLHRRLIDDAITSALLALREPSSEDWHNLIDGPIVRASNAIHGCRSELYSRIKNPGFKEENEWRLIIPSSKRGQPPLLKFRAAGPLLIPYLSFRLWGSEDGTAPNRLPLDSITLGPRTPSINEGSIELLLKKCGYGGKQILRSKVQMR